MLTHQLTENVKILHKVALICGNQVLILRRSNQEHSRPGLWDLPGGNAIWPETSATQVIEGLHFDDITREVLEETNIDLRGFPSQFNTPVYCNTYLQPEKQVYTVMLGWSVQLDQQSPVKLSNEHSDFAWISPAQFDDYDFGFAGEEHGFIRQLVTLSLP